MKIDKIFGFFVPKDRKFFPLFAQAADNLVHTSELLTKLLAEPDHTIREDYARQIKEAEHKGDNITHALATELSGTFITPFDREDIHSLTEALDNVVDHIHAASKRIQFYKLASFPIEFIRIAEKINDSAKEIQMVFKSVKNGNDFSKHYDAYQRISEMETEVDDIYQEYLASLFDTEINAIDLIKKRDILSSLEKAIDACDDVAKVFSTLSVKLG